MECACRLSRCFRGQTSMCLWPYSQHVGKEHSSHIWVKLRKPICFPVKKTADFIFALWTTSNIPLNEFGLLSHSTLPSVLTCLKFQSSFKSLHFLLRIISMASLFEVCLYARQLRTGPFRPSRVIPETLPAASSTMPGHIPQEQEMPVIYTLSTPRSTEQPPVFGSLNGVHLFRDDKWA